MPAASYNKVQFSSSHIGEKGVASQFVINDTCYGVTKEGGGAKTPLKTGLAPRQIKNLQCVSEIWT